MSSRTVTKTRNAITLKGSTAIVTEFFGYAINSILYQRGIYPPDEFSALKKYGLQMMVSTDKGLAEYLKNVLVQLSEWLQKGNVKKLVVVLQDIDEGKVLERWTFNIETDKETLEDGKVHHKQEKAIMKEIQAIIRQITSSVTFLPLIECPCAFDLLVFTDEDVAVPEAWEESDPKYIKNSEEIRLRSFTTKVHKVDTTVSFRADDDED